jgi:hypothetical protein
MRFTHRHVYVGDVFARAAVGNEAVGHAAHRPRRYLVPRVALVEGNLLQRLWHGMTGRLSGYCLWRPLRQTLMLFGQRASLAVQGLVGRIYCIMAAVSSQLPANTQQWSHVTRLCIDRQRVIVGL